METQTKPRIEVVQDVNPRVIYSALVIGPFDEAKAALEEKGYRVISLEDNARLRIQEGKYSENVSKNGNRTREAVVHIPQKGIFLTKNSPIMQNPEKATNCHRNNQEFYLNNDQVEESLADSVELSNEYIPTNDFKNHIITVYAFGEIAEQYGQFLREAGIEEMPFWLTNLQDKPFARQVWFLRLDYGSGLLGDYRNLDCDDRVRGVRESAEVAAKTLGGLEKKI